MIWFIIILFSIFTIVFLAGKGSFLISGYNTASEKEKAKYDEKKLCHVMGYCMGAITIALIITKILFDYAPIFSAWFLIIVIIMDVAVMLILTNTICKSKSVDVTVLADENSDNKIFLIGIWAFAAVVLLFAGIMLVTGDVNVNLKEDSIEIVGSYWTDMTISYDEITEVSITDDFSVGSRTNGIGSLKINEGYFKNTQFGKYILYANVNCKSYVIMHTDSGIVVVNGKDSKTTEKLYDIIREKIGSK